MKWCTLKKIISLSFIVCLFSCQNNQVDYYDLPTYSVNNRLQAVIEIPAGTNKKFEYNKKTKTFEIDKKKGEDRVIQFLPYLGNYGYIPSTYSDPLKGGDGDTMDVLVLSESLDTGTVIEIIPIAILKLIDDGELDYKIIAIPFDKNSQIMKISTFQEFSQIFPIVKQILELWFLNYNKDDEANSEGWGDEKEAVLEIKKSMTR